MNGVTTRGFPLVVFDIKNQEFDIPYQILIFRIKFLIFRIKISLGGFGLLFFDFETFCMDWLVVIYDMDAGERHIIVNDKDKLQAFYNEHRSDIWCGYNAKHYDQYILKGILLGLDPKKINDFIIVKGRDGWQYSSMFSRIPLIIWDVMNSLDRGLKYFEGAMGNDIRESTVPFDIDRKLTPQELSEVIQYCTHDVEQTIEVFLKRQSDFDAQIQLLKMFNLPLSDLSRTKVQLSAKILEAQKRSYDDEFDISFPDTLRLEKYQAVLDWYKDWSNRDYKKSLTIDVAGVPHAFGWGGVHGARERYSAEGYFINMDVASLYPSLMIRYNLHSRSCNPQKFNDIVKLRLEYKHAKNPLQAPLKIVINGTYGAMKDKFNPLYDPRQANNVCIYGQLLLLDLIEKLEKAGAIIIQSNTDGVLVRMPDGGDEDAFFDRIDDVAHEWETRTGLTLEFDEYRKVYQKDVNNYVIVDGEGKFKSKGAYVKKLSELDYDLAVVNRAIVDYLVKGVPIESTIMTCNSLKEFQIVKKISSKYKSVLHDDEVLNEKCVRVFASTRGSDGGLFKIHATRGNIAKVEGTPEHSFIVNGDVGNMEVPQYLDRAWYIDLAKDRVKGFIGEKR